jgi:hypothetical protein
MMRIQEFFTLDKVVPRPCYADFWVPTRDGDYRANEIFCRHYSKYWYRDGRKPKKFIGPGEYICLVLPDYSGLFVWRKFISADGQQGVNCSVFRNESSILSSLLILEAEKWAWDRWPGERLYTYINVGKIRSQNPGCCFKKAGWKICGVTKINKLLILEKFLDAASSHTGA